MTLLLAVASLSRFPFGIHLDSEPKLFTVELIRAMSSNNSAAALSSEIEIMHADFNKHSGGNKYMTRAQLQAMLQEQCPDHKITDDQVVSFAGDHGDDKISFDEYVCGVHDADWIEVISVDDTECEDFSDIEHSQRWINIFKKADVRSNELPEGQLDKSEFRRIKRLIRARNATSRVPEGKRLVDQKFEEVDTNCDGGISQDEFMKMIEEWQGLLPKSGGDSMQDHVLLALEKSTKKSDFLIMNDRKATLDSEEEGLVRYLFKRIDQDNSGAVSFKEFMAFRQEFYFTVDPSAVVESIFSADKNDDDKIDEEEFCNIFKAFKASLAKNHLGGMFFKEHLVSLILKMYSLLHLPLHYCDDGFRSIRCSSTPSSHESIYTLFSRLTSPPTIGMMLTQRRLLHL